MLTQTVAGVSQPRSGEARSAYTNCVITCVWGDGLNKTPAICYSYNPEYRQDWNNDTPRRKKLRGVVEDALRKYSLNRERIVYVGDVKGEKRQFVAESASLIRKFIDFYQKIGQFKSDTVIMSDKGSAFVENKADVFQKLGFANRFVYEPAVHMWLSPNDNKVHGVAKQKWRSEVDDFSQDSESTCNLLYNLDNVSGVSIRDFFAQNFLLRCPEPSLENSLGVISRRPKNKANFYIKCLEAYRQKFKPELLKTQDLSL